MIQTYKVQCRCNRPMIVTVDSQCSFFRVYCQNCKSVVFDHTQRGIAVSQAVPSQKVEGKGLSATVIDQTHMPGPQGGLQATVLDQTSLPAQTMSQIAAGGMASGPGATRQKLVASAQETTVPASQKNSVIVQTGKFGNYSIEKELGAGASGKVYLATDNNSSEKVALKILQKPENSKVLDYFLRESQILLQLKHPNIICMKGRGNHGGFPYIAMEFVEGETLGDVLRFGAIDPRRAARIICDIAKALEHAAIYKIVHRDIKPDNIFISAKGAKLIDLGLGKVLDDSVNLTKTGQAMGTPYYMPLEQILDAKRADQRSDIYALGATMYHTLCGQPPYHSCAKNVQRLFQEKMDDKCKPISKISPSIPADLIKIVEKAMAHEPEQRYENATKIKQALEKFIAE